MTIVETVYKTIDEWDEDTQKTIIKKHKDINTKYDGWWQFTYEQQAEKLKERGFDVYDVVFRDEKKYNSETGKWEKTGKTIPETIFNISFSGFWSQGDGASFTTDSVDIIKWLEYKNNPKYSRILKLLQNNSSSELYYSAKIIRESRYVHERSTTLYINWEPYKVYDMPNVYSLLCDIEKEMEEDVVDLSQEIYKALEEEYEYMSSDEVVKETLIANQYEFDENGERL